MKSKQLSYCKIWGAFKINGSEAIASFGGNFCKFWGARKINGSGAIASF